MKPFEQRVSCKYGAPMGRSSIETTGYKLCGKVHLQRVQLYGDYDKGGAYWGGTLPLWCAWHVNGAQYLRAPTREAAKALLSDCEFYR